MQNDTPADQPQRRPWRGGENRKRAAEGRLERDDVDSGSDDEQPTASSSNPQNIVASAEVMQTRRIRTVRRPAAGGASDAKPTGAFSAFLGSGAGAGAAPASSGSETAPAASAPPVKSSPNPFAAASSSSSSTASSSATPVFGSVTPNASLVPSVFGGNSSSISFDFSKPTAGSGASQSQVQSAADGNGTSTTSSTTSQQQNNNTNQSSTSNVFQTSNFSFNFKPSAAASPAPIMANADAKASETKEAESSETASSSQQNENSTAGTSTTKNTSNKMKKLFPPPGTPGSQQLKLLKFEQESTDSNNNNKEDNEKKTEGGETQKSWQDHGTGFVELVQVDLDDDDSDEEAAEPKFENTATRLIMRRAGTFAIALDVVVAFTASSSSSSAESHTKTIENSRKASAMFKMNPPTQPTEHNPIIFVGFDYSTQSPGMFCIRRNTAGKGSEAEKVSVPSSSGAAPATLKTLRSLIEGASTTTTTSA